jgi:hypothetical protein
MVEDASLDDFLGGDGEDEQDTGPTDPETSEEQGADDGAADGDRAGTEPAAPGTDAAGAEADGETASAVTPATTTYAWSDEGTTCEACGEPAERRWHQDGALVCPGCKEW